MRLTALTALALLASATLAPLAAQADRTPPTVVVLGGPDEGRRAPDFTLPWATKDTIGPAYQPFGLWKTAGKTVVLAFYPRDFTPGCTSEMRTFADQYETLFGPDVVVVGISADSLATHQRFAASLSLPFMLLSDPDQRVAALYASKDKGGYNRRTVFVIGRDGRVRFRNMTFRPLDPKDYDELKRAVQRARRG